MMSTSKPVPLFILIPVLGFGLLFFVMGCWFGWSSWDAISSAARIEGMVVDLVEVKAPKPPPGSNRPNIQGKPASQKPGFAPVVEYQIERQTYRVRGHVSTSNPSYKKGDKVVVRYPPGRPSEGCIDSFSENWLGPIVFAGGGFLFTVVGFALLAARRGSTRTQNAEPDATADAGA